MKAVLAIVGCLLLGVCATHLSATSALAAQEKVPGDQERTESAGARATAAPFDAEQLQQRTKQRGRRMWEQRMLRVRETLGVESDEDWSKLAPAISRLQQRREAFRLVERSAFAAAPGELAAEAAVEVSAGYVSARLSALCPGLDDQDWKVLAAARSDLARAYYKPGSTEEEIAGALDSWRRTRTQWDAKIAGEREGLLKLTTPRQEAGLVLLGALP